MLSMTSIGLTRATATIVSALAITAVVISPAAAQQRNTISRLPSAIYLPNAGTAEAVQSPASTSEASQRQIKNVSALPAPTLDLAGAPAGSAAMTSKVEAFVSQNAKELGVDGNAAKLVVKDTRETLTGRYIHMEQTLNGIPIIDGHIQVTVDEKGSVQSVTRNIVDVPIATVASVKKTAEIQPKAAEDIVWKDLKVTGDYLEPPQTDKAYLNENNVLTLVYVVKIAVSKPFGYWEYVVDANSGRIISKKDRRIKEDKQKRALTDAELSALAAPAAVVDQAVTLAKYKQKIATESLAKKKAAKAGLTGKAFVFEPNPVSTLNDGGLKDGDTGAKFDQAYIEVTLEALVEVDGKLNLQGPLVRIEDFEPPATPPSTAVGGWTARRGDNAFNDVMTYYHIHKSLTYLRSLGYSGGKDLFPTGIAADSDGVGGADNSHYVPPPSDRLAFGHGCVDDNEDTDVILHELGHAIHNHVNPQWGGGDSGAIGEGFGDYWAISQRMRMKNGLQVDPGKIFPWDAIDGCWDGRRVDRDSKTMKYNPALTYEAHASMGGFQSDELWSTPLVRALSELLNAGESHDTVDQVVLEAMAGIGRNFTMRSLALATVAKAKQMFPAKSHAAVFEKHFKAYEIIK